MVERQEDPYKFYLTKPELFTCRQSRVLELYINGYTRDRIGIVLGISKKTVDKFIFGHIPKTEQPDNLSNRIDLGIHGIVRREMRKKYKSNQWSWTEDNQPDEEFSKAQCVRDLWRLKIVDFGCPKSLVNPEHTANFLALLQAKLAENYTANPTLYASP